MEHINERPEYENFFFSDDEGCGIVDRSLWNNDFDMSHSSISKEDQTGMPQNGTNDKTNNHNTSPGELSQLGMEPTENDPVERLPSETNTENNIDEETKGDMMRLNEGEELFEFEKIVDHRFEKMALILKVRYRTPFNQHLLLDVPFGMLKKDHQKTTARYIRMYVMESTKKGQLKL